jgi:hypothetical protein
MLCMNGETLAGQFFSIHTMFGIVGKVLTSLILYEHKKIILYVVSVLRGLGTALPVTLTIIFYYVLPSNWCVMSPGILLIVFLFFI